MLINGGNYFNETALNELCNALDNGETVDLYIDCIGHTRNNNEQEAYRSALYDKYGEKLHVEIAKGSCSYYYTYKLK